MEIPQHEKASYAFYTYVFNNYDKFINPLQKYMRNSYIDDKSHEIIVQNAICKMLAEKIKDKTPSKIEIKQSFDKSVRLLCKQDLNLLEFDKKFKERENKLKTYFKLHYALENISDGNFELDHACLLIAIYSKLIGIKSQSDETHKNSSKVSKLLELKNSSIYKYLNSARKEEKYNTTLSYMCKLTLQELVDWLYTSMAIFDYSNDTTVIDSYIGIYDNGDVETIFNEVSIIDLENNPASREELVEIINNEFNEKLINELHLIDYSLEK